MLQKIKGTLSCQDEFVNDDEKRRVRSGSRTSSKCLSKLPSRLVAEVGIGCNGFVYKNTRVASFKP